MFNCYILLILHSNLFKEKKPVIIATGQKQAAAQGIWNIIGMNVDLQNIEQFNQLSHQWWDPAGPCKTLHHINPERLAFITRHANLTDKKILDLGCGGGILTEALAKQGGLCTGIDLSGPLVQVAKLHAELSQLKIDYQEISAEELAQNQAQQFDLITCMEMLEHVPDPDSILKSCLTLLKPGGHLFLSTLNRKPKSFILGIVAAEYLLNLIPQGTHTYAQFIRPSELCQSLRKLGFSVLDLNGLNYHPFTHQSELSETIDINYLLHAQKPVTQS